MANFNGKKAALEGKHTNSTKNMPARKTKLQIPDKTTKLTKVANKR